MTARDYALDAWSPGVWVAEQLDRAAPAALPIDDLARNLPAAGPDLTRIQLNEKGVDTETDARLWLVRYICDKLAGTDKDHPRVLAENSGYRLADGITIDSLYLGRKKVKSREAASRHEELFNLLTVNPIDPKIESGNIRNIEIGRRASDQEAEDELRWSMREFGWVVHFPAIKDEKGVVLVGHRRLKIAGELGIEPQWETVKLGRGEENDAKRLAIALASNIGFRPMDEKDRGRIAVYLYGEKEWSQARIAQALRVSQATISGDLRDAEARGQLSMPDNRAKRGGRPPKPPAAQQEPTKADNPVALELVERRVREMFPDDWPIDTRRPAVPFDRIGLTAEINAQLPENERMGRSTVERIQRDAIGKLRSEREMAAKTTPQIPSSDTNEDTPVSSISPDPGPAAEMRQVCPTCHGGCVCPTCHGEGDIPA